MAKLEAFVDFAARYTGKANFVVVYLEEAHPTDGWMYPAVSHFIRQHASLKDRVAAASILQENVNRLCETRGCRPPLLCVDAMANQASIAFGALPERLSIIQNGSVAWIGGRGPMEYSLSAAEKELRKLLN